MRPVEWHSDALDDLVEHDAWRVSHGWEPMAGETMDAVTGAIGKDNLFPKQRCRIYGEVLPVYRTWVEVRSKRFMVYFLEAGARRVIRRILHPKRNRADVEE